MFRQAKVRANRSVTNLSRIGALMDEGDEGHFELLKRTKLNLIPREFLSRKRRSKLGSPITDARQRTQVEWLDGVDDLYPAEEKWWVKTVQREVERGDDARCQLRRGREPPGGDRRFSSASQSFTRGLAGIQKTTETIIISDNDGPTPLHINTYSVLGSITVGQERRWRNEAAQAFDGGGGGFAEKLVANEGLALQGVDAVDRWRTNARNLGMRGSCEFPESMSLRRLERWVFSLVAEPTECEWSSGYQGRPLKGCRPPDIEDGLGVHGVRQPSCLIERVIWEAEFQAVDKRRWNLEPRPSKSERT
ncbi:hypothetical protein BKA70DRAFT_1242306 [Coprinopsis sp. MPI-PUGE-AT-0042]|nr:hypothetical protein BKA70DRAFT_1242306 [Coprinopsis sp. MPI-PUGE-AT-0042]